MKTSSILKCLCSVVKQRKRGRECTTWYKQHDINYENKSFGFKKSTGNVGRVVQLVEQLITKCKALSSTPVLSKENIHLKPPQKGLTVIAYWKEVISLFLHLLNSL
jgi:hypothetical protein